MPPKAKNRSKEPNGATLGFEAKLWAAADALRNNMDAAEYKTCALKMDSGTILDALNV